MTFSKLLLSSKQRTSSSVSSSDFKIKLPRSIQAGDTYRLVYAHIPNTVHNIDSTNNTFVCSDGTATLTPGFYTSATLIVELETKLNALAGETYTVTFSEITQKITVSAGGAFTVSMNGVTSLLGFTEDTASATSFTGDSILNLEKNNAVYISVNDEYEIDYVSGGSTFVVPLSVNSLSVVELHENNSFKQTVTFNNPSSVVSICMKDEDNNTVDLHGSEWFIVLEREGL